MKSIIKVTATLILLALFIGGQNHEIAKSNDKIFFNFRSEDKKVPSNAITDCETNYSTEDLCNALLENKLDDFHSMLGFVRKKMNLSNYEENNNSKKTTTLYFSSSKGDDRNDGLSPSSPKKNINEYSGKANVTILLKCNDTFYMSKAFDMGINMRLSSYGGGERPVLNFFSELKVKWKPVKEYKNVWKASLRKQRGVYDGTKNTSNCNLGILKIDDDYNWKRKNKSIGETFNYPLYLQSASDDSWAIDWETSIIYMYSKKTPNSKSISFGSPSNGVSFNSVNNSKLVGIEITGASKHGISIVNSSDVLVSDCYIHHIGGACLNGHSTKYGNAIEIWENAKNILIEYNIAEWIYDTCYTNQGDKADISQKNIIFRKNIGLYSYCGIESWGDYSKNDKNINVLYEDNLLMYACDVTAPDTGVFMNPSYKEFNSYGKEYTSNPPYISYRKAAYPYQQMALLNVANVGKTSSLAIISNVFWGTNRFLSILVRSDYMACYPIFKNNVFYTEIPEQSVHTFRSSLSGGKEKLYFSEFPVKNNNSYILNSKKSMEETDLYEKAKDELLVLINKLV